MIFLRYESFQGYIRMYPVTSIILLINLLLYLLVWISGGANTANLLRFGALVNVGAEAGSVWRYIASIFLHGGLDHLLFNSFAIFIFAPPLERLFGTAKYAIFYLASGVAGNLLSVLLYTRPMISVGASGAVYGFYGAYIFMILFRKHMLDVQSRKTVQIFLIIGIVYSFMIPQINIYAHFGGFLGGLLLTHVLLYNKTSR